MTQSAKIKYLSSDPVLTRVTVDNTYEVISWIYNGGLSALILDDNDALYVVNHVDDDEQWELIHV